MISRALGLSYAQLKQNAMAPSVHFVEAVTPPNHDITESKPSNNNLHAEQSLPLRIKLAHHLNCLSMVQTDFGYVKNDLVKVNSLGSQNQAIKRCRLGQT